MRAQRFGTKGHVGLYQKRIIAILIPLGTGCLHDVEMASRPRSGPLARNNFRIARDSGAIPRGAATMELAMKRVLRIFFRGLIVVIVLV
jgi:hypothetical protein